MQYRKLGKTGLDVSILSLGTEYLVKATAETISAVVHAAVAHGVNYFDVLFSEPQYRDAFGSAFQGLRDQVIITGHLFVLDPVEKCRQSFMDHLARLKIDAVDIVFVSCCDGEDHYRQAMQPGGHYDLALEMVRQGKAKYIGFSSHTVPVAMQAVRSDKFDLLMFPINPAFDALPGETGTDDLGNLWNAAYEHKPEDAREGILPTRKQLYYECAQRNIGLVAMKPFAAGWLFRPDLDTGFNPLNLIHYALSQPGVTCALPGVANLEQLEHNLGYLSATDAQKDFSAPLAHSRWNPQSVCMYCNHCQPCTAGIDISEINRLLDLAAVGPFAPARQAYQQLTVKASDCQACGDCVERCPFDVNPQARMKEAVALFE